MKALLQTLSWDVSITRLIDVSEGSIAEHVIVLADFEGPLLFTLTEEEFAAVQRIIASTSSLLWVSTGAILSGKKPEFAMVSGLARAITSEQASIDFRTLDIDTDNVRPDQIVQSIAKIAQLQLVKVDLPEREFAVASGKTYISRLVRNNDLNEIFTGASKSEPVSFVPGDRIAGTVIKGKVVFRQGVAEEAVKPGHVEVQVQYSGLTKEGVLAITGLDYATTFSHEIGGIVTRVAPGVVGYKRGDRVIGINVDRFGSYQQVPTGLLRKLDPQDDMVTAVSTLTAYSTALHGLENLAALQEKENVLILHGSGTAGTAAIKVAQLKGATAYVVAETDDEVSFLQSQFGLSLRQILKPSDGLVSEQIDKLTGGRGADVVFSAGSVAEGSGPRGLALHCPIRPLPRQRAQGQPEQAYPGRRSRPARRQLPALRRHRHLRGAPRDPRPAAADHHR